jgi:hypothetical protein
MMISDCINNGTSQDAKRSRRRKLLGTTIRDYYTGDSHDNNGNGHNESSPLELDSRLLLANRKSRDYSTFDRKQQLVYKSRDNNDSFLFTTATYFWQRSLFATFAGRWWLIGLALIATCLMWARRHLFVSDDMYYYNGDTGAEWEWDHNVYMPRKAEKTNTPHALDGGEETVVEDETHLLPPLPRRNVLVAQIAASPAFHAFSSISSRPNRAYARQWKMNFVRISGSSSPLSRECLDRVHVLHSIVEKQELEKYEPPPAWPLPPRIVYDAILFLPPDAIITDLDFDLLRLIPNEHQLVSIAGWPDFGGSTDILLVNLRHSDMLTVARKWLELVQPTDVTCGNHNDVRLLVAAMESVTGDAEKWIRPLSESKQGFVENNAIKCIPFSVPESRAQLLLTNAGETKALLQATADAVCYRYYPKCEVF